MTQKFNYDDHPIDRVYIHWANTLDSTGKDSASAANRISNFINNISHNLRAIVDLSERSDAIKKFVFYGKDPDDSWWTGLGKIDALDGFLVRPIVERSKEHNMIRMYHAILGLFTEIGELANAYMKYVIEGTPIDWPNIAEESGDLCWYMALLARAQGYTSFDEFMAGNKAKLTARYGNTWTQDGALNRDTGNEMKELESAAPITKAEADNFARNLLENGANIEFVTPHEIYGPEEEIEAIDRAIEIMLLRRHKLQGQTTVPAPPPHKYPPITKERKEAILKKYTSLASIVTQLSACMYVTQDRNHRIENNEAFIALHLLAEKEFMNKYVGTDTPCVKCGGLTIHMSGCPESGPEQG